MNPQLFDKEKIKEILRQVKPYFNERLGKYTHKQSSDNFYFRSLAFSRDDMGYVFGFNMGFFRTGESSGLNNAGMNVVIRENGEKPDLRKAYSSFFKTHTREWINRDIDHYSHSQRDGSGIILPRYLPLEKATNENELIDFMKQAIDGLNNLYPAIIANPDDLFFGVVRAAPFWNEDIISHCKQYIAT